MQALSGNIGEEAAIVERLIFARGDNVESTR
jgi:hypothetical protein